MITSIRLRNWRSHSDSLLEFKEGTNLLIGAMGSGKSSVLDALSFALFGTFPALERRKLKLQDLFRLNEDSASVNLDLSWMGSEYQVERSLKKGKQKVESEARIFKNGSMLESGPSSVNEYISQTLGMDYDLFTRAVYSEQNGIDYFLTLDPRRRKQEIDTLLGLDRFEIARTNIVSVLNRIKSDRKLLESRFDPSSQSKTRERLAELEKELESIRIRNKDLFGIEAQQKSEQKKYESELSEMKKKKEGHETFSREKLRLDTVIGQLKNELEGKSIDDKLLEQLRSELKEKKALVQVTKDRMTAIDSSINLLSREAGAISARKARADQAKVDLEKSRKELEQILNGENYEVFEKKRSQADADVISIISEMNALAASVSETKALLERLKPGIGICPLCESDLGEDGAAHVADEKNKKIILSLSRVDALSRTAAEKKKAVENLSLRAKKAVSLIALISSIEKEAISADKDGKELVEITERLKIARVEKESVSRKLMEIEARLQSLLLDTNKAEEMQKKHAQLGEAEKKSVSCNSRIAELGFQEGIYEELRSKSEQLSLLLERSASELRAIGTKLSMIEEMSSRLKKELADMEEVAKDVSRFAVLEEELSLYRNALLETQTSLRSTLTEAINSAMKEVWPLFYPHRNYSSIRLSVSDRDYSLEVKEGEDWKTLESVSSGGERACAALSLRTALAVVLAPNLSWLILDEPTHNLDAEAVTMLSETLQTKVPEVVKQIFVITHEEGLIGADFAASYRLQRDKSAFGPTKIERI